MLDYRLYKLDGRGRIADVPLEFKSESDEHAIQKSESYRDGADLELWQQARRVKTLPKLHSE